MKWSYASPMLASLILTAMFAQTAPPQPAAGALVCGNQNAEIPARRSSAGYIAVFKLHSDDDHNKNSHQCAAHYSIAIQGEDGKSKPNNRIFTSIDAWQRPIGLQMDGFSQDGSRVYLVTREGGVHPGVNAFEYDMRLGRVLNMVFLDRHFLQQVSRTCVATLHIAGISPEGLMILASSAEEGCAKTEMWLIRPNARSASGEVFPEYPKRLLSSEGIVRLDPGKVVGQ